MERDKHFTTGVLAVTWVAMLAILLTAFTLYPRGFLPALEFLGFPFILANIFLLYRLTAQGQYKDLATYQPKNPAATIYAVRRRAQANLQRI
jgi:hypothetical protein